MTAATSVSVQHHTGTGQADSTGYWRRFPSQWKHLNGDSNLELYLCSDITKVLVPSGKSLFIKLALTQTHCINISCLSRPVKSHTWHSRHPFRPHFTLPFKSCNTHILRFSPGNFHSTFGSSPASAQKQIQARCPGIESVDVMIRASIETVNKQNKIG